MLPLNKFLTDNRADILLASERRTVALAALRPTSEQMQKGLPIFFDQLVEILATRLSNVSSSDEVEITIAASAHGRELLRLGYTLSHVVHSYGAMCQAITEVASEKKAPVTAIEFHILNRCLDIAIAGAVTEFESIRNNENKNREVIHLGTIAHELRNALNRARISFQMLAKGIVGLGGSTSKVLERSLEEMDTLINRSLSEVRLRADSELNQEFFTVIEVVSQLIVTAEVEAERKNQTITVDVDSSIGVFTDRHLMLGALGNLVQNALKFSGKNGKISITGKLDGANVKIDVSDQAGGIPIERVEEIFKPFSQQNKNRSGVGLGLLISKQAIEKCGGSIHFENIPGGSTFTILLPAQNSPEKSEQGSVV